MTLSVPAAAGAENPVLGGVVPRVRSLGTAMAGGNPILGREDRDFYPTPAEVTRALLAVESFAGAIWEPACGDDAIVREFEACGHRVVATDICPLGKGKKLDFFAVPPRKVANIVTNPPFDLAEKFIRHGLAMQPDKLCLMLKASYWHAVTRQPLYAECKPARIYPLTWRPDFMQLGRPTMEVMWCVWDATHDGSDPRYIPLLKAECDRDKPRATRKKRAIS
jgi:hypothetical protein